MHTLSFAFANTTETNHTFKSRLDILQDALPGALRWTFEAMDVADRYAGRRGEGVSFMALYPSPPLGAVKNLSLYEAHCKELRDRHEAGEDLRPGTWAEIAATMSEASLKAPLTEVGASIYARALRQTLGAQLTSELEKTIAALDREPWPGAIEEELTVLRRRLAVADRR